MRQTLTITRTELQTLFFSPIAWFILIVFIVHSSLMYIAKLNGMVVGMDFGFQLADITYNIFTGTNDIFAQINAQLFYYVPLLTMGVMSREYNSGSIKLLYSSPISNTKIVVGKFIALALFALLLVAVLGCYIVHAACIVDNFDYAPTLIALLGTFLVICSYMAVGIFMSSVSPYPIIAALATLVTLTLFTFVGRVGQDVLFLRDVTYWLSVGGRSLNMTQGLLCSEDVIYFITLTLFFISLTIIRMYLLRTRRSAFKTVSCYLVLFSALVLIAFVSSRPVLKYYYDSTSTKRNTINVQSQDIMLALKGNKLTLTTYVNIFGHEGALGFANPKYELKDMAYYSPYLRFKPDTEMRYVYYQSTKTEQYRQLKDRYRDKSHEEVLELRAKQYNIPLSRILTEEEVTKLEDVAAMGYGTFKVASLDNGRREYIPYFRDLSVVPSEANILAAFRRLTALNLPKVGYVTGHGERSRAEEGNNTYFSFTTPNYRYSLYNLGFEIVDVSLDEVIEDDINILMLGDLRTSLSDKERANYLNYIEKGGNVIVLGEPKSRTVSNELLSPFGAVLSEGVLVGASEEFAPDLLFLNPSVRGGELSYLLGFKRDTHGKASPVSVTSAASVEVVEGADFTAVPLLSTHTEGGVWAELGLSNFSQKRPTRNESEGEVELIDSPVIVALTRELGSREQRVIISGDADFISGSELSSTAHAHAGVSTNNSNMLKGLFHWLSGGVAPVDMRRAHPNDNTIVITRSDVNRCRLIMSFLIPALLVFISVFITLKRKSK